jgi:hypothetical protein
MSLRVAPPAVATAEALPEIVSLLERVFPRERPWAPDLDWQYLRNPAGPARYVNAYSESGALIAHYGLLPMLPLAEPPAEFAGTYLSLNVAADPAARVPGLMIATTRALYRHMQADGRVLILGVTNENSEQGFVKMLGFRSLGQLSLTAHLPGMVPKVTTPRALAHSDAQLRWRTSRPGVVCFAAPDRGALMVRLHHRGVPLDAVLSAGLEGDLVGRLGLPRPAVWTPMLYAGFGGRVGRGVPVPAWLRPSPLAYVFRVLGDNALTEPLAGLLLARRFEFLDFDVV